ncbi:MAG: DNA polymerase III subunit delta [candidate division WOR-3 bacterium]
MRENSLYILLGEDDIRAEEFLSHLKRELEEKGVSYESEILDCEEIDIPTLAERLLTNPLFVEKKLLILKNSSSLFSEKSLLEKILPILKKIATTKKSPVLVVAKVIWSKEIESSLKKEGLANYTINLYRGQPWAIKRELRERARREGYIIDEDCLSLILEYAGEDYTQVYQEYEKVKLYAKTQRITRKELEEVISPSRRFPIQELGNAFRNRDRKRALLALHNLYLYAGKLEVIIGYLAAILFRLLAEEKNPLWEKREVIWGLKELVKIDKRIKTTSCDGETLLCQWLVSLLK